MKLPKNSTYIPYKPKNHLAMTVQLTEFAAIVMAASTLILVFVTYHYAWTTSRILVENQRDRKIKHLEHRLEKLYYPLLRRSVTLCQLEGETPEFFHKYQYLGSPKLKMAIDEYYTLREQGKIFDVDIQSKILDIVKQDIPKLLKDLDELAK